ncbi:DinB family protein [Caldalkalibacillus salinus]|uniref:DinB family protein n=1 Tax=Caldalkalibacillus salinus TaxID=2803787 RepID=UPI001921CF7D|nr:DinB family protein [Caldalkalibacillus salinus]
MKKRHVALFKQLQDYRGYFFHVLEGVTEAEAEMIPDGFKNNIRWNLGHVYLDQYLWIEAVTREQIDYPRAYDQWFGFGTTPADFTDETPSFDELKEKLYHQVSQIERDYGHRLEEVFPPTEMEDLTTIEQAIVRMIFHEGMHVQAVIDFKKFIKAHQV